MQKTVVLGREWFFFHGVRFFAYGLEPGCADPSLLVTVARHVIVVAAAGFDVVVAVAIDSVVVCIIVVGATTQGRSTVAQPWRIIRNSATVLAELIPKIFHAHGGIEIVVVGEQV